MVFLGSGKTDTLQRTGLHDHFYRDYQATGSNAVKTLSAVLASEV